MRNGTVDTAFDVFRRKLEIAAALNSPMVQRTVTKQAVESFPINTLMARKIEAICIAEKFVIVFHCSCFIVLVSLFLFHRFYFQDTNTQSPMRALRKG